MGANYFDGTDDSQWFGNFTDANSVTHYSFAHLEQQQLSLNMRLNYTAKPDLTFEFYGEPFIAKGTYTDFREVSATPGADSYAARYKPYTPPADRDKGFNITSLRTNAVMRWEYRPGSTLFLVWTQERVDVEGHSDFDFEDSFQRLADADDDNIFLAKLTWYLSR